MKRLQYIIRQSVYTIFSFCYFLGFALDMTIRGFILITCGGATDDHKRKYHQILQQKTRFVIHHVPGTTFSFLNQQEETFETPSVMICNHQSHLDLMAIMMLTPNLIILTKDWVWKNPFYGLVIRYADFFPIGETEVMIQKIKTMVEKGYSVMIFPEGTRSEDCHIQRFHRGAFYLADQLHLDIVPLFITGFGKVLPKTSFHLHPGHMSMEVMPRICYEDDIKNTDYREMTRRIHRMYVNKET